MRHLRLEVRAVPHHHHHQSSRVVRKCAERTRTSATCVPVCAKWKTCVRNKKSERERERECVCVCVKSREKQRDAERRRTAQRRGWTRRCAVRRVRRRRGSQCPCRTRWPGACRVRWTRARRARARARWSCAPAAARPDSGSGCAARKHKTTLATSEPPEQQSRPLQRHTIRSGWASNRITSPLFSLAGYASQQFSEEGESAQMPLGLRYCSPTIVRSSKLRRFTICSESSVQSTITCKRELIPFNQIAFDKLRNREKLKPQTNVLKLILSWINTTTKQSLLSLNSQRDR